MLVLGAGFGLGVAVAVSRVLAGAAPRLAVAGLVVGAVVGLLLAVWVVGTRGCCTTGRCWIAGSVTSPPRCGSAVEELVATRVRGRGVRRSPRKLAAREETEAAAAAEKTAAMDAELREHAVATARAAAQRTGESRRYSGRWTQFAPICTATAMLLVSNHLITLI